MSNPCKILLLEDNKSDADLIERQLKKSPLNYDFFHEREKNGYLKRLEEFMPNLVLCDYQLPSYTGFEAFNDMKRIGIESPFILITGILTDEIASKVTSSGIDDYLLKDRLWRLPQAIERNLQLWEAKRKITKETKKKIQDENTYRLLVENASDIIASLALDRSYTFVSPACKCMLGYEPSEIIGTSSFLYIHEDDISSVDAAYQNMDEKKVKCRAEYKMRKKDGSYIKVESTFQPLPENGNLSETIVLTRDISDRNT